MTKKILPWSKEYKVLGIPDTLEPYPDEPVYDMLENSAKKYKKSGLIQYDNYLSYADILDYVNRLATAFVDMGLKKGDRVATLLPTSMQFFISDYAISRAGLVHVPASSLETVDGLKHKLKQASPGALICLTEFYEQAKSLVKKTGMADIILTRIEDFSSPEPDLSEYDGNFDNAKILIKMIKETNPSPPDLEWDVEKDIETLLFTGGTTGVAKGCMLTHRNIYANATQNLYAMGQASVLMSGTVSMIMAMPFFHSYGHLLMHSMTMLGHTQILIPDPRDTGHMVKMINKYLPVVNIGVPTQFMKICEEELKGKAMLGISGSAPLPKNAQEEYEKSSGGGILEGYGLSEMSPTSHLNSSWLLRIFMGRFVTRIFFSLLKMKPVWFLFNRVFFNLIGKKNMGRLFHKSFFILNKLSTFFRKAGNTGSEVRGTIGIPFPDTKIKIVAVDTGKELTWDEVLAGQAGEMYLNGPQRMLGYWPNPGSGIDSDGYIHTGDVVKVDSNGYFYVVDRTKDMINVSGYKVYSREIDDILYTHPAVEMAATLGIPDPEKEGSERVVVYLQLNPGNAKKVKEEDIIEFLRQKVAKYAVPKSVTFVDSMPLTEVEKVDKKLLREMAKETIQLKN